MPPPLRSPRFSATWGRGLKQHRGHRFGAANAVLQPILPAEGHAGSDQPLGLDVLAEIELLQSVGYHHVGLEKRTKNPVCAEGPKGADDVGDLLGRSPDRLLPSRTVERDRSRHLGAVLIFRREEELEFEQVAQRHDLIPEGRISMAGSLRRPQQR